MWLDFLWGWSNVSHLLQMELQELRNNPIASLSDEEVVIGSFRSWPLFVISPAFGALFGWLIGEKADVQVWLLMPVGGAIAGILLVLLLYKFLTMSVTMDISGVRLSCGRDTYFFPWLLFHASGEPFRKEKFCAIVIPTNPRYLREVERMRNGVVISHGVDAVKPDFLPTCVTIDPVGNLELTTCLELPPQEFAQLLKDASRAFVESATADRHHTIINQRSAGSLRITKIIDPPKISCRVVLESPKRVRMNITQLDFPPYCFLCGAATQGSKEIKANQPFASKWLRFSVPCCRKCSKSDDRRRAFGPVVLVGSIFVVLTVVLYFAAKGQMRIGECAVASGVILLFLLPILSYFFRSVNILSHYKATYHPRRNEVCLTFLKDGCAARIADFHNQTAES